MGLNDDGKTGQILATNFLPREFLQNDGFLDGLAYCNFPNVFLNLGFRNIIVSFAQKQWLRTDVAKIDVSICFGIKAEGGTNLARKAQKTCAGVWI